MDINAIKIENNFKFDFGSLNPRNWFRRLSKDNVNILFVDDTDMPVVAGLRNMGYHVKKIKDIRDVDDAEVKNAEIIFVDFDGVGRTISPQHQGIGVIKELKTKYRKRKFVVLYTAQPVLPSNTALSELFNFADARMRKDEDVTDFVDQIRKALEVLK